MPPAEVAVDEVLVRELLEEQHPDLAASGLVHLGTGWDNEMFRLGETLTVRLPRRALAAELVEHEQRWLPELAPRLPLAIPVPVRRGRPSSAYPWSWTIGPWIPGRSAGDTPPDDQRSAADALGAFVRALHVVAPNDAPDNPYRGTPLADRDEVTRARIGQLGSIIDGASAAAVWDEALDVGPFEGAPVWLHGDLHPANLVVRGGRITAVIDFGDITSGDPATDLAVAWALFDSGARTRFRLAAGRPDHPVDDATWARARGWALSLAVAYLANSADNEMMAMIGRRSLTAVLADTS